MIKKIDVDGVKWQVSKDKRAVVVIRQDSFWATYDGRWIGSPLVGESERLVMPDEVRDYAERLWDPIRLPLPRLVMGGCEFEWDGEAPPLAIAHRMMLDGIFRPAPPPDLSKAIHLAERLRFAASACMTMRADVVQEKLEALQYELREAHDALDRRATQDSSARRAANAALWEIQQLEGMP